MWTARVVKKGNFIWEQPTSSYGACWGNSLKCIQNVTQRKLKEFIAKRIRKYKRKVVSAQRGLQRYQHTWLKRCSEPREGPPPGLQQGNAFIRAPLQTGRPYSLSHLGWSSWYSYELAMAVQVTHPREDERGANWQPKIMTESLQRLSVLRKTCLMEISITNPMCLFFYKDLTIVTTALFEAHIQNFSC